ncbi:MAG TPA: PhoH family protein [Firmicutes bacterium]|nr:PhoH-like ATPase [Bacillota bacterium]HHV57964.1 PhoH family protein [Bacillota bacterium]
MPKTFVLDTSVLLYDPSALYAFAENEVVIPAVVLEEVDGKKRLPDEVGRNARTVAHELDALRGRGHLTAGVPLPEGGSLRVELNHRALAVLGEVFPEVSNDNRILAVALNLTREAQAAGQERPVILVSKDAMLRIKADSLGVRAEDYESGKVARPDVAYSGVRELLVPAELIDRFYREGSLPVAEIPRAEAAEEAEWAANEFAVLKDLFGTSRSALARYVVPGEALVPLHLGQSGVWGISPRNREQRLALELLLDDSVSLVTLSGPAGTGKTLLALAAGLAKTQDEARYRKLLIARPIVPVGKDLGYLPGDKEEKLRPWMQPVYDNLEFLFGSKKGGNLADILAGLKNVEVEALTYIRGRSLPEQFIIIDEAQNLTRHEVKTIISRVGAESKIVLVGDTDQIDHPYLDARSNGLSYVVERFRGVPVAGHIALVKGERSELAALAARLL